MEEKEEPQKFVALFVCGFIVGFLATEFVLDIKEILLSRL